MILQALHQHYHRLLQRGETGLPLRGYSQEKISACLTISAEGALVGVMPLLDTSGKKPQPRTLTVPQPEKRTSGIKPNFLWDKTSYVLGVSGTSRRVVDEHAAFKASHSAFLADQDDVGLRALARFLARWEPTQFTAPHFKDEMKDSNLVFRLDGDRQFLHERAAAVALRSRLLQPPEDEDGGLGHCLVTGGLAPLARLHPAIKGVNGAQSSGASIVSFNQESFASWGKEQGANAPVSDEAAFAYTTVLNHLLRRDAGNRQRLNVGDTTLVFWAESGDAEEAEAAEWLLSALNAERETDGQATARLHTALEAIAQGRPLAGIDPRLKAGTRMVILGLAPNASRLSIRYWLRDSLGVLAERLRQHMQDLWMEPKPWKTPPTPWRLALCTAPSRDGKSKSEDVSPLLAGELMRAILSGGRYPHSLLANLVMRFRADGDLSALRVALCKAVLCRDARLGAAAATHQADQAAPEPYAFPPPAEWPITPQEVPVSLDSQATHPAYLLGRLFAVLEGLQRAALGGKVNATIRDRYYGAGSATPALVFPLLVRHAMNHLARLRKDKPGLAVTLEKDVQEIIDKLPPHFPRSLNLKEQGRFAIGYYHQAAARFAKTGAEADTASDDDTAH